MSTALAGQAEQDADPDINETIRRTVKALRSAREVDAVPLAQTLGISRASFYSRLNGAAPFLAAEIFALAKFFGVPIADFYEGVVRINRASTSPSNRVETSEYPAGSRGRPRRLTLVTSSGESNHTVAPGYGSSASAPGCNTSPDVPESARRVNNANAA